MDRADTLSHNDDLSVPRLPEEIDRHARSLVIRLWLEEGQGRNGQPIWRGTVIRVGACQEQHVKTAAELFDILAATLDELGADLSWRERLAQLLMG